MDKRKLKSYRDRLLARREGLFRQGTEAEMSSRERDLEATQDPADMAANAYTKELLISMSANDRGLLALIDEALHRIETGGFGECVNCGEPVPEKRRKPCRGRATVSMPGFAGARFVEPEEDRRAHAKVATSTALRFECRVGGLLSLDCGQRDCWGRAIL